MAKPDHLPVSVPLGRPGAEAEGTSPFYPPKCSAPQSPQQTHFQVPAGDLAQPQRGQLLKKPQIQLVAGTALTAAAAAMQKEPLVPFLVSSWYFSI